MNKPAIARPVRPMPSKLKLAIILAMTSFAATNIPVITPRPVRVCTLIFSNSSLFPDASALIVSIPLSTNHPPSKVTKKLCSLPKVNCA